MKRLITIFAVGMIVLPQPTVTGTAQAGEAPRVVIGAGVSSAGQPFVVAAADGLVGRVAIAAIGSEVIEIECASFEYADRATLGGGSASGSTWYVITIDPTFSISLDGLPDPMNPPAPAPEDGRFKIQSRDFGTCEGDEGGSVAVGSGAFIVAA